MTEKTSRSRAHPAITLREAVEGLETVVTVLGPGPRDRDALARALGYTSGSTGIAARKIAAMAHFGLLDRRAGLYEPSRLAHRILHPTDDADRRAALREAFLRPPVFQEVADKYEPEGQVPQVLAYALATDHGITDSAKDHAADVFMSSAQYAGVLTADGVFLRPRLWSAESGGGRVVAIAQGRSGAGSDRADRGSAAGSPEAERQIFRLHLSEGMAELSLPRRLSRNDLEVLRRQFEVLEAQVADQPAAPLEFKPHRVGHRAR